MLIVIYVLLFLISLLCIVLLSLLMAAELLGQDAAEILKVYSNLKSK